MSSLRIGLVGCGRLAQEVHLPILTSLPGVEVVALADPDVEARASAARLAPSAQLYPTHTALLDATDLDAVVACPPTAAHAEVACDVLAAGRALYLEKPIATTLDDAGRVVEAWRAAGVPAMLGFNYRLNPLYADLGRRVREGEVGEVVALRTTFSKGIGGADWRGRRGAGGGVLLEIASHHVDLVRHLLGDEVVEVSAHLWSRHSDDDTATLDLRMASGVPVQMFCSLSAIEDDRVEVIGERGVLRVSRYESLAVEHGGPDAVGAVSSFAGHVARSVRGAPYLMEKRRSPWNEPSFRRAMVRFVDAVRSGKAVAPDPGDGARCLAVLLAAETSAREGRLVAVGDETGVSATAANRLPLQP